MSDGHDPPPLRQVLEPWCAGLPRVATRAVTEFERSAVERRMVTARRRAGLILAATAFVAGTTAALILPGRDLGTGLEITAVALVLELGLVGLLATLLSPPGPRRTLASVGAVYLLTAAIVDRIANDVFGRSLGTTLGELTTGVVSAMMLIGLVQGVSAGRRLLGIRRQLALTRQDLRRGERLEQYEGPAPRGAGGVAGRVLSLGTTEPDDNRPRRLELLPSSRLVVRANGRPVRPWITLPVVRLAPARLHAFRVDLPDGVARERGHRLQRRGVSPGEARELRGHALRLVRTVGSAVLVCGAAAGYVGARARLDPRFDPLGADALLWYAAATTAALLYLGRVRAALRLREDARVRWLVTVHNVGEREEDAPRMEVLPVSRLVWTENGRPPRWRITS